MRAASKREKELGGRLFGNKHVDKQINKQIDREVDDKDKREGEIKEGEVDSNYNKNSDIYHTYASRREAPEVHQSFFTDIIFDLAMVS